MNETKLVSAGCTIYTADDWRDGDNHGGRKVAAIYTPDDDLPGQEHFDMADRIVRCVNSHDALLAACEAALVSVTSLADPPCPFTQREWNKLVDQLRAAIAAAKGATT